MQEIAADIGAREHVLFGGIVAEDARFIRKKMARKISPELRGLRDGGAIEAWAAAIAATLSEQPLATGS
jgi:hypothetical protein